MPIKSVLSLLLAIVMLVVFVCLAPAILDGTVNNLPLAVILTAVSFFGAPYCFGVAVSPQSLPGIKTYLKLLGAWTLILGAAYLMIALVPILAGL